MKDVVWKVWKKLLKNGEKPVSVGKEVSIELKSGEQVTLVCELIKDGHATFFTKDLLEDTHVMNENWITGGNRRLSTMEGYLEKLFHLLPDGLQDVICGGKLRLLREREVFGENRYGKTESCEQLPRYQDLMNRTKRLRGVPFPYWLAPPPSSYSDIFYGVCSDGTLEAGGASTSNGVCFGFEI